MQLCTVSVAVIFYDYCHKSEQDDNVFNEKKLFVCVGEGRPLYPETTHHRL